MSATPIVTPALDALLASWEVADYPTPQSAHRLGQLRTAYQADLRAELATAKAENERMREFVASVRSSGVKSSSPEEGILAIVDALDDLDKREKRAK